LTKFVLTGSSQFRLKQNMTDSMAGRVAFLKLLPFSVKELKDADTLPSNPYRTDGSRKAPTTALCRFVNQLDTARRFM